MIKNKVILYLSFFIGVISYAQNDLWTPIDQEGKASRIANQKEASESLFHLDMEKLKVLLHANTLAHRNKTNPSNHIEFPDAAGDMHQFTIAPTAIMHPDLAKKFPDLGTYKGKSENDYVIHFSITDFGFHAQIFTPKGTEYIEPIDLSESTYKVIQRKNLPFTKSFRCHTPDTEEEHDITHSIQKRMTATDSVSSVYRMAMAATVEYSSFQIRTVNAQNKSDFEQKQAVLSAVLKTLTRVNGIYNRDFAITLQLIPDNDKILFIDSDQLDNDDGEKLLDQIQGIIDQAIGFANYDIGHVVSTGGGGIANLKSVCTNDKARGVTGLAKPIGDTFDVDFVSHEIGHQFGAYHTFNNSCTGSISQEYSYEPGSGSTIMAYAGICPINPKSKEVDTNVQKNTDDYFHAISIQQINEFVRQTSDCAVHTSITNKAPIVEAGNAYFIPHSTPFKLTGQATDTDNNLTYCWEQFNKGFASGKPKDTQTTGAVFRSQRPTDSPTRYFPKMETVLANEKDEWEVLPSVARTLNFVLSVRDNNSEGGFVGQDQTKVTTINQGPFQITSQSAENSCLVQGIDYRISWDVAGTDANGINTSHVNIKLSQDNGVTFATTLIANTPNDGEEIITIPQLFCDECRLLIEPTNGIYYAVSPYPFSIGIDNGCLNDFLVASNRSANTVDFQYKTQTTQHPIRVTIYDMTGRQVAHEWFDWATFIDNSIDVSDLSSGIYIFHLQESNHGTIRKVIISNRSL